MFIRGNFDSGTARLISIRLNRCVETESLKCKSEDEITQYFKNKFIFFIYNERRFDSNQFLYDSIVSKAHMKWIPVNTQVRQSLPFKVKKQEIFLQDLYIDLDDVTEI